jgi:hypothetical protein
VTCFGLPFYAGWGFTDDRLHLPRRTRRRVGTAFSRQRDATRSSTSTASSNRDGAPV